MRKTFQGNWWRSSENNFLNAQRKRGDESQRSPTMQTGRSSRSRKKGSSRHFQKMDNKVMNININNYYIQTLRKRKKRVQKTSRGESGFQEQPGLSKEVVSNVRRMQDRLKTNEDPRPRRTGRDNQVIKKKVDKILKKYFMNRQKSLRFKIKPKRCGRKSKDPSKENRGQSNTAVRKVKTGPGRGSSGGKRRQLIELMNQKKGKKDKMTVHSSKRKGLFENSSRRSLGILYDRVFEQKKSVGRLRAATLIKSPPWFSAT